MLAPMVLINIPQKSSQNWDGYSRRAARKRVNILALFFPFAPVCPDASQDHPEDHGRTDDYPIGLARVRVQLGDGVQGGCGDQGRGCDCPGSSRWHLG